MTNRFGRFQGLLGGDIAFKARIKISREKSDEEITDILAWTNHGDMNHFENGKMNQDTCKKYMILMPSFEMFWTCLDFWNRRIFRFLLMPVDARWLCFTGDARRATRLGSALNSSSPRGEPSELRSTWRSSLEDSKWVRQPREIYETMVSQTRPACDFTRHDMTRHAWRVLNVPVLSKRCQYSC